MHFREPGNQSSVTLQAHNKVGVNAPRLSGIGYLAKVFGVPYGSRTRVAAVKEKRITVIQCNLAAWIALYRT